MWLLDIKIDFSYFGEDITIILNSWLSSFLLSLLILRERERERESMCVLGGGAEKERERERILSRLHTVSTEPDARIDPTNCEITT